MDSKVQAKVPDSRRKKFIIIGLIAVICVLSYQLYSERKAKKEVVRRKTFLVGKLHEYRVASEDSETKYKEMRTQKIQLKGQNYQLEAQNKGLISDLAAKQKDFDETSEKLQDVQKSADEIKKNLSELTENYNDAMSKMRSMEGELEDAKTVCDKHKENSQSLNQSIAERTRELETCRQEKVALEQNKQVLAESEQYLRNKIEEMGKVKSALSGLHEAQPGQSNAPQGQGGEQSPVAGQVKQTSFVAPVKTSQTSQVLASQTPPAQSSLTLDQKKLLRKSFSPIGNQVTPSFKRAVPQTMESSE